MSQDVLIGIDAGTSVIKAVAFDREGRQLAVAGELNVYVRGPGGAVEQDMLRTWSDTAAVLRRLAETVPNLARRTVAVAVTAQGDGTWLIGRDGEPVAPALLWLDARAAGVVEELERSGVRQRVYRYTGCGLNPCQQNAQLLWLSRHRPDLMAAAAVAFHCKDWLYFRLTGERVTDTSEGIFTFGDFRTRRYVPEVLEALGLPAAARLLPPMLDGTRTWHQLTPVAARETGLVPGTPIVLGAVDIICTGLGAGLYTPGHAADCSILGSTGIHMRYFEDPEAVELGDHPTGYTIPFPVGRAVARMQSNMSGTLNIDWITDLACEAARLLGAAAVDRKAAIATLDARVLAARPGAAIFHPYIDEAGERGPFVDPTARAQFTGLSNRAGFVDLMRSVYEGLGFAARDCYQAMGGAAREVRLAGGGARSHAVKTILASALGVPVREVAREEAGAAGAAMMAAVALGLYSNIDAVCRQWVEPRLTGMIRPDPELASFYSRLFPLYQKLRRENREIWQFLAEIRRQH